MKIAINLALNDIKKTFKSYKIYLIIILTLFFVLEVTSQINSMAEIDNLGVTPYVYPMFVSNWSGSLYTILLIIVLMSDAPYECGAELFIRLKVKKEVWYIGKVIYIAIMSVIYQLIMVAISVIGILKNLAISTEWGEVLEQYWYSMNLGTTIMGDGAYRDLPEMQPIKVMGLQLLFAVLVSIFVGELIFIINASFKNYLGSVIVGAISFLHIYSNELQFHSRIPIINIQGYVPTSWISLQKDSTVLDYSTEIWILLGLIFILGLLGLLLTGKKVITITRDR